MNWKKRWLIGVPVTLVLAIAISGMERALNYPQMPWLYPLDMLLTAANMITAVVTAWMVGIVEFK